MVKNVMNHGIPWYYQVIWATTLSIFNDFGIDGEEVEEFEDAQTIQLPLGHLRWNKYNSKSINSKHNKIYRCLQRFKWEEGNNIIEPINVWFNFGTNKWMLLCRQREFNYNIKDGHMKYQVIHSFERCKWTQSIIFLWHVGIWETKEIWVAGLVKTISTC
jgi:hypothetical protein